MDFVQELVALRSPHAVASIEGNRPKTETDTKAVLNFSELVESLSMSLARPYEVRWQMTWGVYGYGEMKAPLEREIW